jgi:hypothetical protein
MDKEVTDVTSAEVLARLSSRKDFLKMVGATGLGAAIGSNVFLRQAFALDPTDPTDPSFRFSITNSYHPFDVISDNFIEHSDSFSRNQALYKVLAPGPEYTRAGVSINRGQLRAIGDGPFFTLLQTNKAPLAPYASVVVDVKSFIGSANNEDTVYAGLIKDASNYVMAWYNNATKRVGIDAAVSGTVNTLVERTADLGTPVRFAFVLNSKEVTALADEGGGPFDGWKPVANFPNPPEVTGDPAITPGLSQYVDLRDPAVLAQYKYGFGVRGDGGTITLDGVEAGYWGRAGVRDPHVVTWADGTPYIDEDNKLYLTLTNAGLDFFATAHWGVYTLDLSTNYARPEALEEVGKLFFKRDGKVFGDHAGHIVYDGAGNFLIGVSTWGDFTYQGVQVNYTRVSGDVLHGVHVLEATKLPLPPPLRNPLIDPSYPSTWDPHFVRINEQWYVAYVESPSQGGDNWDHHPALATGSSLEAPLSLVGRDEPLNQTEGMVMQKVGGTWYVLCVSGGGERGGLPQKYRVYDLNMVHLGYLNADFTSNIPHPMVTPLPFGGDTKWIMLTFDETDFYGWSGPEPLDYGTHGKFYVMDGPTWDSYYEFPPPVAVK